jgi:hypothetical protein
MSAQSCGALLRIGLGGARHHEPLAGVPWSICSFSFKVVSQKDKFPGLDARPIDGDAAGFAFGFHPGRILL